MAYRKDLNNKCGTHHEMCGVCGTHHEISLAANVLNKTSIKNVNRTNNQLCITWVINIGIIRQLDILDGCYIVVSIFIIRIKK